MKVRICSHEDVYWLERKVMFGWKKLPSIHTWLELPNLSNTPAYHEYYKSYENARDVASEYIRRFGKNVGVATEVLR